MSAGKDIEGRAENMGLALVGRQGERMLCTIYEVGELIYLTSEEDGTKDDGSQQHPARTVQVALVNGRNCQSHEKRTRQKDEGTKGGQFDIENISYVQIVPIDRCGNLAVDEVG